MLNFTKFISSSIENGARLIKVLRKGKSDVQTAKQIAPFGIDSNPIKDMVAVYGLTQEKGKPVIIGYVNKSLVSRPGEYRAYSTNNGGEVQTYVYLKNDGTMEIGGNSDFMVRYNALNDGFNQLKSDHNALAQKWDAFCAAYTPGSPATVGTPPTLAASIVGQSTANISGAKIEEIKTL